LRAVRTPVVELVALLVPLPVLDRRVAIPPAEPVEDRVAGRVAEELP
jgi:hypothetical protein